VNRLAQRFYLATDDDAIALDGAVSALQNGEAGARSRVIRLEQQLRKRVTSYLLATGEESHGGNLLVSSAVTASEQSSDLSALARVRRDIAEARARLAADLRP
jgi:hypothetical protein